jgi:PST family polysaccharide transporter
VILQEPDRAGDVAWLSLGVALTVAAGAQGALLTGLRRVSDLARINVAVAIIGSALAVLCLWLWGEDGLVAMVLIGPVLSFMLGHLYVARLGPPAGAAPPLKDLAADWQLMAKLGFAFMLSGLVTTLGHLAVRTLVQREAGTEALGQFQAAWAIGSTYLGFVLGAMGTDYYPRLTAAMGDKETATRLVNEQTEVALLLCAPVLLAMLGFAPWVIRLLYTPEFAPAAEILRWQLLGDVLKVVSWPLGFVLLAAGAGKTFVVTETIGMTVFMLGVLTGLPLIGITSTGVAFFALYVAYLPLVWWLGGRLIGFRWTGAVKLQATTVMTAALLVEFGARWSDQVGAAAGAALAAAMSIWALKRLSDKTGLGGRIVAILKPGRR